MFISLVSGTPYLYGVYSPQLVQHVGLSMSDAATISVAVNMGLGIGGFPAGMMVDRFGPRTGIMLGSVCIFSGYWSLHKIYDHTIDNLVLICLSMALVGLGSVTCFFSGLKAAQANFTNHRGAAGAIPVGAYGLAATIFSLVAARFFAADAGGLLRFLALCCGSVAFVGAWFVHIYPPDSQPDIIPQAVPMSRLPSLHGSFTFWGIGKRSARLLVDQGNDPDVLVKQVREQRKLGHRPSSSCNLVFANESGDQEDPLLREVSKPEPEFGPMHLIKNRTFHAFYLIFALASSVPQMYIYTVGFVVRAQFSFNDMPGLPEALQAVQVSTISVASFGGRIVAGFLSDHIYKTLKAQRQWVVLITLSCTFLAQILVILTNSVHAITLISLVLGFGYGLLNGTYPAIIADEFGTKHFTSAWGLICSGPLFFLLALEKYFGYIYDSHSDDSGVCHLGNACYSGAFEIGACMSLATACIAGILMYSKAKL